MQLVCFFFGKRWLFYAGFWCFLSHKNTQILWIILKKHHLWTSRAQTLWRESKPFSCLMMTPVSVYSPLCFSFMFASQRLGNVTLANLWIKMKHQAGIHNMQRCSSSALLSEPDAHHAADTSDFIRILIRESIKFYCINSDPDFELCWLERYTMCWQDVSENEQRHTGMGWGYQRTKHDSLNNYTNAPRVRTEKAQIWLEKLTSLCWYNSSLPLWKSCLAWGLTESTSYTSDKAETMNELKPHETTLATPPTVVMWCGDVHFM